MVTSTVRLERPLGEGGMGSVWVAEHLALKTTVVVKFMSKELAANADAVERFSREAAAAAQVKSPHVVHTLDYGVTAENVPYIVMELLDGHDLGAQLVLTPVLSPRDVADIIGQAAKALARAHGVGIVHRDIKPDNIFLCDADGGDVFVKLLDFGIAKSTQALGTGTRTGSIIGTPSYMSPEQITGAKIDHRTDLWSLGAVAFEAMTGKKPYDGDNVGAIALSIHGVQPVPSALNPALSPAIDAWFARACAVDVQRRFSSAKELAQSLAEAVSGAASVPRILSLRPERMITGSATSELGSRPRPATQLAASIAPADDAPARSPKRIAAAVGGLAMLLGVIATVTLLGGTPRATAVSPISAAAVGAAPATFAPPSTSVTAATTAIAIPEPPPVILPPVASTPIAPIAPIAPNAAKPKHPDPPKPPTSASAPLVKPPPAEASAKARAIDDDIK